MSWRFGCHWLIRKRRRKISASSSKIYQIIKMVKCTRCCLYQTMKTVNLVVNLCGIGMIIYSLWLLKCWKQGFMDFDTVSSPLPRPLFIYTFLGVGIVVCLSTLCSHMIFNFISPSTLSFYIAFVCFLLFLQGGFIVAIFFKIDWQATISKWTDGKHEEFQNFLNIHLTVCRSIALTILFAQVNAALLAVVLWAIGPESRNHCGDDNTSDSPELKQSFLVRSDESIINPNETGSSCINRTQFVF